MILYYISIKQYIRRRMANSRGIRNNWEGLMVRIDKTKEIGVIKNFDKNHSDDNKYFVITVNNANVNYARRDFSVIRKQS
jgi:hypothetical protein